MSRCQGISFGVTNQTGSWGNFGIDQKAAFAYLQSEVINEARKRGFECEGRECVGDLHALCEGYIDVTPTYKTQKPWVVCVYSGEIALKCRCKPTAAQAPRRPKKIGKSMPSNPPTTATNPYPVTKTIPCGTIIIAIAHDLPGAEGGSIIFDFTPAAASELCDCDEFGWIQHFKRGSGAWHYDNRAAFAGPGGGFGALSDPTQSVQPTQPPAGTPFDDWKENPWYGSGPTDNFPDNPTPQIRIGDRPTNPDTSFVTQLVCAETGEVLFSWYWGPVPDGSTHLERVPAGQIPPP
jgi:hypothetical protein